MSRLNVPVALELVPQLDAAFDDDELLIFAACASQPKLSSRFDKFSTCPLEATKAASFLPKVAGINVPKVPDPGQPAPPDPSKQAA